MFPSRRKQTNKKTESERNGITNVTKRKEKQRHKGAGMCGLY